MATATKEASPLKVVTGAVRISYAYLTSPRPAEEEGEKAKYGCTILVPKTDKETIAKIEAAIQAVKDGPGKAKWGGKLPKALKITFRDGDEEKDLDDQPEYAGMMFMSVTSNTKPGIVDRQRDPILDEDEVYSGMWARVSLKAAPFDFNGTKGVTFYLNHVQKVRDDDNLTGRTSAEDDFDDLEDDDTGLL